jgi:hypothetical protein
MIHIVRTLEFIYYRIYMLNIKLKILYLFLEY